MDGKQDIVGKIQMTKNQMQALPRRGHELFIKLYFIVFVIELVGGFIGIGGGLGSFINAPKVTETVVLGYVIIASLQAGLIYGIIRIIDRFRYSTWGTFQEEVDDETDN